MRSLEPQRSIVVFDRSDRVSVASAFLGIALVGIALVGIAAAVVGDDFLGISGFLFFFSRASPRERLVASPNGRLSGVDGIVKRGVVMQQEQ